MKTDEQKSVVAYVGLGSNLGDTTQYLSAACDALHALPGVQKLAVSSVYTTEPLEILDAPFFANQVIALACAETITPFVFLDMLNDIEKRLGRQRVPGVRYSSRTIDLDLLLFGDAVLDFPQLTLPHPRMCQRAFVLIPLLEIAPELFLPDGTSVRDALAGLSYCLHDQMIFQ